MILEKPQIHLEEYDPMTIMKNIEKAMRVCYRSENSITSDSYKKLLKMAIESGHESVLEHEKITVQLRCSVGTYKDLTRHRVGTAWSIESTRWCRYNQNKFDNELHFIKPDYIEDKNQQIIFLESMKNIEEKYMEGADAGMTNDMLRLMLPHATAATVVMTCNIREWRHILKLRTQKNVHPEIRQLLIPLLIKFQYEMPELFSDITFDINFNKKYYANID